MITSHNQLAKLTNGKKILLLNSLGKDSILCLDWLYNYAYPSEIISVHMKPFVPHPKDQAYQKYLKRKFPKVTYINVANPFEITAIMAGNFQNPAMRINNNTSFYDSFNAKDLILDLKKKYNCDYTCIGKSKYESYARAKFFNKFGLENNGEIYPLGLMTKKQVYSLCKNIKLHPVYKLSDHTLDTISYYQMRSTFLVYPEYYEQIKVFFPHIELDKFRYEVLLK